MQAIDGISVIILRFQYPTQMYRQFGNSVAVPMMKAVADAMKEELAIAEDNMYVGAM